MMQQRQGGDCHEGIRFQYLKREEVYLKECRSLEEVEATETQRLAWAPVE